eukprot:3416417-Rhodomonas_salina.4
MPLMTTRTVTAMTTMMRHQTADDRIAEKSAHNVKLDWDWDGPGGTQRGSSSHWRSPSPRPRGTTSVSTWKPHAS